MSKEDVALKLTLEAIKHIDKTNDIDSLSQNIYSIYNNIYKNLIISDSNKTHKLEDII